MSQVAVRVADGCDGATRAAAPATLAEANRRLRDLRHPGHAGSQVRTVVVRSGTPSRRTFATFDAVSADLVKLRFFAGLSLAEAAQTLGVVRRTADRYWAFARSFLYAALRKVEETAET